MRTSFKIRVLLLTAVVGLTTFAVIKCSREPAGPIGLGLRYYGNAMAVFNVTNLTGHQIHYDVLVERKLTNDWPNYRGKLPLHAEPGGTLAPGEASTLTVPVMVYAPPYPWRLSVFCYRNPAKETAFRFRVCLWLLRLHLPKLTKWLWPDNAPVQVSGSEMAQ